MWKIDSFLIRLDLIESVFNSVLVYLDVMIDNKVMVGEDPGIVRKGGLLKTEGHPYRHAKSTRISVTSKSKFRFYKKILKLFLHFSTYIQC